MVLQKNKKGSATDKRGRLITCDTYLTLRASHKRRMGVDTCLLGGENTFLSQTETTGITKYSMKNIPTFFSWTILLTALSLGVVVIKKARFYSKNYALVALVFDLSGPYIFLLERNW